MTQKFIIGDIVEYDNKIMVVKEPRDGSHFDLSCHNEGLVYCFVDIDEIKPVSLTPAILEKNGWDKERYGLVYYKNVSETLFFRLIGKSYGWTLRCGNQNLIEKLEFVHQLQNLLFGLGLNSEMEV